MTVPDLIRWGALSAVLGGLLWIIADLWDLFVEGFSLSPEPLSQAATTGTFIATMVLTLLGAVLLLFGLVSFNLHQSEAVGNVLGRLGFLVAFVGTALWVGAVWSLLFVVPPVAVVAPTFLDAEPAAAILYVGVAFSFLVMTVGWVVFGFGALRARSFPRWVSIVLIIGALIQLVPFNSAEEGGGLLFGVAVALLGYFTLIGRRM
jgi:hypothetical protein